MRVTNNSTHARPALRSAVADSSGVTVTLAYDQALDADSVPDKAHFTVTVDGVDQTPTAVSVSGSLATLIVSRIGIGDLVKVSYDAAAATAPLRNAAGWAARGLSGLRATNNSAHARPAATEARVGSAGTTVTLTYDQLLDSASVPAASNFTVKVNRDDRTPTGVTVAGSTVTLTVGGTAVTANQKVAVTYNAAEATTPIRNKAGWKARGLSGFAAISDRSQAGPPTVQGHAWASTPTHDANTDGTPETYGAGAKIRVRLTFTPKVTVDTTVGRPRLKIRMHATAANAERWAVYESGSGTTGLVFAYTVASGDSSKGGSPETDTGMAMLANTLELNGGTIRSAAGVAAVLEHDKLAHNALHKVDWSKDGQAPEFSSADVNLNIMQVVFDEALDGNSRPAGSSFCVTASPPGGSGRRICGSSSAFTAISGGIQVTLSEPVRRGETVTVGYTKPASNPLQDGNSNQVESFSGKPVANRTSPLAAPTGVTAAADSDFGGRLTVSWTAPSGTIADYDLRYYAGTVDPPAGREADWIEEAPGLPSPAGTATSATIKGLRASTAYRVQIRATQGGLKTPWSESASATTRDDDTTASQNANNAPRVLAHNGASSGNVCAAVTNVAGPIKLEKTSPAKGGALASVASWVGRNNGETTTWPSVCTTGTKWVPTFDDVDGDELIITAEPAPLPPGLFVDPAFNFTVVQPGNAPATDRRDQSGRVFFKGINTFRSSGGRAVRGTVTATDPHGASVSVRLIWTVSPVFNVYGLPQLTAVDDLSVSVGRAVSLVLPAATGGDSGDNAEEEWGLRLPYYYAVSGLPEGLTFDPETRTISGIPSETGTFEITYTADDADKVGSAYLNPETVDTADVATRTFTIHVRPFIELARVVSAPTHDANGDGRNDTYVRNDRIVVDVEFTEPLEVKNPGDGGDNVRLRLRVGQDGHANEGRDIAKLVDVYHGGKTMRFAYTVEGSDHDPDGIRLERTAGVNVFNLIGGATLKGKVSGLDADVTKTGHFTLGGTHGADGQPRTLVNGRVGAAAGPVPIAAQVDGATLTVTFDEALASLDAQDLAELPLHVGVHSASASGGSRNAFQHPTAFVRTGDDNEQLRMTLGVPAEPGETVTVSYTLLDGAGPLENEDGGLAPSFTNLVAKNDTGGVAVVGRTGVTLVGNTGQVSGPKNPVLNFSRDFRLSFTTGSHAGGYRVTGVDLALVDAGGSPTYSLQIVDSDRTTSLGTFTNPSSFVVGVNRHTAPGDGIDLDADTTYWLVLDVTAQSTVRTPEVTLSDVEDAGSLSGWSISSTMGHRAWNDTRDIFDDSTNILQIAIHGDVKTNTPPLPHEASVAGTALKIVFDRALDEDTTVSGAHFKVATRDLDDALAEIAGTAADVTVSGSMVTVTLAEAVAPRMLASVTYDPPTLSLMGADGNSVSRFADFQVATVIDTVAPALTQVGAVQTDASPPGVRVVAYYDEALAPDSVPAASDFSVTVDTKDAATPTAVALEGSAVVLTLDMAAAPEDEEADPSYAEVDVTYTKGTNPIRDLAGNEAAAFTRGNVAVEASGTPEVSAPAQTGVTLVGNTGQVSGPKNPVLNFSRDFRLSFTTGSHAGGYRVTGVDLALVDAGGSPTYSLQIVDSDRTTSLGTFTNPSSFVVGLNRHTAPGDGIDLDADTTYWLVLDVTAQSTVRTPEVTPSDVEDAGSLSGWSISSTMGHRAWNDTRDIFDDSTNILQIAIHGDEKAVVGAATPTPVKLVGSTGQTSTSSRTFGFDAAQAFTTGSNVLGYRLTSVKARYGAAPPASSHTISIHASNASDRPGDSLGTLSYGSVDAISGGLSTVTYTASGAGILLRPGTAYLVVLDTSASPNSEYHLTSSDDEDAGAAAGWSLADGSLAKQTANTGWTGSSNTWMFDIHGHADTTSVVMEVDGASLTISFDKSLDPASVPAPEAFTLRHVQGAGVTETPPEYGSVTAVAVRGRTVVLELANPVLPCAGVDADGYPQPPFTLSYAKSATGPNLRTISGHLAPDIDAEEVGNAGADRCAVYWLYVASEGSVILRGKRPFATGAPAQPAWFTVTASGGPVTVTGAAFDPDDAHVLKLTLDREFAAGETVTVSYTRPQGAAGLWDASGRQLADLSDVTVTRLGPAAAVAVVSDAGEDATYAAGETIRVKVTFDEPVDVDTAGGVPRLAIDMDPADWGRKWAAYESGSGTAELVFAYRVAKPNESSKGIAVLADTLEANGGSITLPDGGAAASLRHRGLGHDPTHKVDWRLAPAGAASVTGVALVSDAGSDGTYALGETVRVRVTFSEAVEVDAAGGAPRLKIDMDPANWWGEKWAAYESGSGTAELVFAYEVVKPNESTRGVAVPADTLEANGGAVRAAGAGGDAHLSHEGLGHDPAHKVDWRLAPEAPAGAVTATGVSVVSTPAVGDTYELGETIRVKVTFGAAVEVDTAGGTPRLAIDMDPGNWGAKWAGYEAGSGTNALTFAYEVVWPNESSKGIAVPANTLEANGGTIRASGANAHLSHAGLGHDPKHKVDWRPTLSVADAEATEGTDAAVTFRVSLGRTAKHRVTVDYATSDGTAVAGEDYTATSGTLAFAPGETAKTVSVPVLDDAVDEGRETFTLRLSNADGARIVDGEATGTIINSDPIPKAWLARFGRTVAEQSVDAVRSRLDADRTPGFRGRIAGEALPSVTGTGTDAAADGAQGTETAEAADGGTADGPMAVPEFSEDERLAFLALLAPQGGGGEGGGSAPESRTGSAEDAVMGTAFEIARETDGGLSLALWGRVARSGFAGREGDMSLDGDVTSAMLGTDWQQRDALFGLMLFRSRGEGGYAGPRGSGSVEADLTGLVPWAGRRRDGAPTIWGAAGTGRGEMTLAPEGRDEPFVAGLDWSMAAAGAEGAPTTFAVLGGASLRWRADALMTRTDSEAVPGLAASSAETSRLRVGLEAAWSRTLGSGATLVPRLELGLRRDGGDAETGFGLEAGGGFRFADPGRGLSVSVDGRALALHEDGDMKDWGLAVSLEWDPRPETRLGPSVIATRGWGGAPAGGVAALLEPEALPGVDDGTGGGAGRLGLEMAWGTDLSGWRHGMTGSAYGRVSGSPDAEDVRLGWRVAPDTGLPESLGHDFWLVPGTGGDAAIGAGLSWSAERPHVRSSTGIDLGAREGSGLEAGFRLTREW